jgi:hypothetical protein
MLIVTGAGELDIAGAGVTLGNRIDDSFGVISGVALGVALLEPVADTDAACTSLGALLKGLSSQEGVSFEASEERVEGGGCCESTEATVKVD